MTQTKAKRKGDTFPTLLSEFFDINNSFIPGLIEKSWSQSVPSVNIIENGKEFKIELAAPGFDKKDFNVNIENNFLTISAEKKEEKEEKEGHFTRKEFSYDSFSRSFNLPGNVLGDNVEAKYLDGILKLIIPKKEESKKSAKKTVKVG